MATVQDRKAPNAGTKVTLGEGGPVTREAAGYVAPESLAAESYRDDGEFAANRGGHNDQPSYETGTTSSSNPSGGKSGSAAPQRVPQTAPQGGPAPSYITSQRQSDHHGPHGKNLTEGDFDDVRLKDGLKMALTSEPGSTNDPSRLAEAQFKLGDATRAGGTGQRDGSLQTNNAYDKLDRQTSS